MKTDLQFQFGLILIILNYPVGGLGVLISSALAIKTGNSIYYYGGIGLYFVSWLMFGLGALIAGPPAVRYSRLLLKRAWLNMLQMLRR